MSTVSKALEIGWLLSALRKKPQNERICPVCGRRFKRRGTRKSQATVVCCSIQCAAKARAGRSVPAEKRQRKRSPVRNCKTCGGSFQRPPSQDGQYCSVACRAADSASFDQIRGVRHYNWKGGITPLNVVLRKSPEARAWTVAVFRRDGFKCRACGTNKGLEAHHIEPWADAPGLRFIVSNGVTLCASHHKGLHWYFRHLRRTADKKIEQYEYLYL